MNDRTDACPRCGTGRLKDWRELSLEERIVADRLSGAASEPRRERISQHRWCIKCWYEETSPIIHLA